MTEVLHFSVRRRNPLSLISLMNWLLQQVIHHRRRYCLDWSLIAFRRFRWQDLIQGHSRAFSLKRAHLIDMRLFSVDHAAVIVDLANTIFVDPNNMFEPLICYFGGLWAAEFIMVHQLLLLWTDCIRVGSVEYLVASLRGLNGLREHLLIFELTLHGHLKVLVRLGSPRNATDMTVGVLPGANGAFDERFICHERLRVARLLLRQSMLALQFRKRVLVYELRVDQSECESITRQRPAISHLQRRLIAFHSRVHEVMSFHSSLDLVLWIGDRVTPECRSSNATKRRWASSWIASWRLRFLRRHVSLIIDFLRWWLSRSYVLSTEIPVIDFGPILIVDSYFNFWQVRCSLSTWLLPHGGGASPWMVSRCMGRDCARWLLSVLAAKDIWKRVLLRLIFLFDYLHFMLEHLYLLQWYFRRRCHRFLFGGCHLGVIAQFLRLLRGLPERAHRILGRFFDTKRKLFLPVHRLRQVL